MPRVLLNLQLQGLVLQYRPLMKQVEPYGWVRVMHFIQIRPN